jgi:ABC-type uncharacterized transport system permease subunit
MLSEIADRQWLWAAAGFYLAGFALGTWSLARRGRPAGLVTNTLIAIGYALQLVGLGLRGRAVGGCPLGNTFEIFQFTAWSATTLYFVVGVTFRLSLLGYFTACLSAALSVASLAFPAWDAARRTKIFGGNPWLELHAAIALFSYGVFALLALTSIMFLARNFSLKSKRLDGWFTFLPSLLDLDHIGVRLLGTGVVLLGASLAVGSVYWLRDTASADLAKIFATLAVGLAYVTALALRWRGRLLARRFAWTCLVLFACALLSLPLVDASRHPAAKSPPSPTAKP